MNFQFIDLGATAVPIPTISSIALLPGTAGGPGASLTIRGEASASVCVGVYDVGSQLGWTRADSKGVWSFQTDELADGSHVFTVLAVDGRKSSGSSAAAVLTFDSRVPTAPAILSEALEASDAVALSGVGDADDTIGVYDGGLLIGETTSSAAGEWGFITVPLAPGVHDFTATANDELGLTSAQSPDPSVTVLSAPIILSASPTSGPLSALTTVSNQLTLVGIAQAGTAITVSDGATVLGTATTSATGIWSFTNPASLADGAHDFTSTASDGSGGESQASTVEAVTVEAGVASFSALTDQWSKPILVGGAPYYVENANVNGNAPWAISEPNDHTLQFDLQPGDLWGDNDSARSEISGATLYAPTSTINLSYQLTVQAGLADYNLSWEILGQLHADDNSAITKSLTQDSPVFAFHLTGADGVGGGDYLAIQGFYLPSGQVTPTAATPAGNPYNGFLYISPQPIVRGQAYSIQVEGSFQDNANGFVEVWLNGVQVVNYHGPIGYGAANYWKEGVYEGWTTTQPITVDYGNTTITTTPGAPVITGAAVDGDLVLLNGTAQANSTVSIYDGSNLLGATTATSSGTWSYTSGILSIGAHSLTATATDSAGDVSAASLGNMVTIAAFSGPIVTNVAAASVSGEAVVGDKITFTVTMSSAVTVSGAPSLTLSDGGIATYASGSGTNTLAFVYSVGAGDVSATSLSVTGISLPTSAAIVDGSGVAAILTGIEAAFNTIAVDTTPVSAPVIVSSTANANGSFTISGTAAPNTVVHEIQDVFGAGGDELMLNGTAVVNANGNWTYTTPTLINGTWDSFTAYDENSLGDISATTTNNGGGVNTKMLPSPVIQSTDVTGNVVTLSGLIPTNYGAAGVIGATVVVYDGLVKLGVATTVAGGLWSFTTATLPNGVHAFTAVSENASGDSASSIPVDIDLTSLVGSPPTISGTIGGQTTRARAPVKPFAGVTIGDANAGATETLTITMTGAGGVLSGGGLTGGNNGVYTLTGSAATVSGELDALTFTPGGGFPRAGSTTDFALSDLSNADATTTVNTTTSVIENSKIPRIVTVAQFTSHRRLLDAQPEGFVVEDSAAAIAGALNALDADSHVNAIVLSGSSPLKLCATQALGDKTALHKISNPSFAISVVDTAKNIATRLGGLSKILNLDAIKLIGRAQAFTLTTVAAVRGIDALKMIASPHSVEIRDDGVHLASLSATRIDELAEVGTTKFDLTGKSLRLTIAQKSALGAEGITLARNWRGRGHEQINFAADGVRKFVEITGISGRPYHSYSVNFNASGRPTDCAYSDGMRREWSYHADGGYEIQTQHVHGLDYSSRTTFFNASGARIALTEAMNSGAECLVLNGRGATISMTGHGLDLDSGSDRFAVAGHSSTTIQSLGGSERFEFQAGFGNCAIADFHSSGRAHDFIALDLSAFGVLDRTASHRQEASQILAHARQVGDAVVITDVDHDQLTLLGMTKAALGAHLGDFRFV